MEATITLIWLVTIVMCLDPDHFATENVDLDRYTEVYLLQLFVMDLDRFNTWG